MGEWEWKTAVPLQVSDHPPEQPHRSQTYWCDFRFTRRATSRRAVVKKVEKLMAAAAELGFEFEEAAFGREKPAPFPD
jgi:hypothetical protein